MHVYRWQEGWTALMWASDKGYLEVVEALVTAGADLNAKNEVTELGAWLRFLLYIELVLQIYVWREVQSKCVGWTTT